MELAQRPRGIDELQAASAVGQGSLFRAYEERLAAGGVRAAQVLLTASDLQLRTHYLNARQTLGRLLAWHVVPVVNENDTTATDEITFGDNDFLAAQVAIMLEARLLVLLTDHGRAAHAPTPGSDRRRGADRRGPRPRRARAATRSASTPRRSGSAGMRSKVAAAEMAGAAGIPARDLRRDRRRDAARGRRRRRPVGTRFEPHRERGSSFKLWLRYAKPSHGTLRVDDGAARVLRERGSSLLPVGITEVEGEFEAGDAVEVAARRRGDRQGNRQLLGRRAAADQGHAHGRGPRAAPARLRGSGAPGLLRPHLVQGRSQAPPVSSGLAGGPGRVESGR